MLPNIISNIERSLTIGQVLAHCKARPAQGGDGHFFCPLPQCRGDHRPHFLVDYGRAHDQYGQPIDFSRHVNKDVIVRYYWRCVHSRIEGYGTVALLAALLGYPTDLNRLTRQQWVAVLTRATDINGMPHRELDDASRNGYLLTNAPAPEWRIALSDLFSPEALRVLGIEGAKGIGTDTLTTMLHRDLGLWQVEKYITAGCYPSSVHRKEEFLSYERRAHALFPIFAFCYDAESGMPLADNPEKRTEPWVARIVMPAFTRRAGEDFDWKADFWTAFGTQDVQAVINEWRNRFSLQGDAVLMDCMATQEREHDLPLKERHGIEPVVKAHASDEPLVKMREEDVKEPCYNASGDFTGKYNIIIKQVEIPAHEIQLSKCVLMRSPLDAACTYIWLNYPRLRMPNSEHYGSSHWHVAWMVRESQLLNVIENSRLRRVSIDVFELFGNERSEVAQANNNAIRYNHLRLCMLPTAMSAMQQVDGGIGRPHIPHTPIDFFRYYEPTADEEARNVLMVGTNVGCKAVMLQKELNGSSALRPFTRLPKKKKTAWQKDYSYEININAAWQMMVNKGYCRSLLPNKKRDTIGQCYRIDGKFIYELDPDSVMSDMRQALEDYAKDNATDPEDAEMMMNAMLRCKDLQYSKNITKLRLVAMPKSESYGIDLDYLFLRNGALEITPQHITFVPYSQLDFLVYQSEVLPHDYRQPFYGQDPIRFSEYAEYTDLLKQFRQAEADGNTDPTLLAQMRQKLMDKSVVGRWHLEVEPAEHETDQRILVPSAIREDSEHNQWLRWWPFMRLLRCFANENYRKEEQGKFDDADRRELEARLINLMFTVGCCLRRYRGVQYMPYFLENTVDKEGKAQGGSGKSVLVEHFFGFARYVCNVNGKDIKDNGDFAKNFSNFIPHHHALVHIEDFPKMPIDPLFNYASGKFRSRSLFENPVEIEHSASPNIVITSNFMVQSTDESSLGRVQFGGMSHYFSREVAVLNKEGRRLDTIYPDIHINCDQEELSRYYTTEQRSQIIYTLAKCIQIAMVCTLQGVQVPVPGDDLLTRLTITELGEKFYDWFTAFLSQEYIYNAPISIEEMFNSFKVYMESAKAREEMLGRARFYDKIAAYCAKPAHGVLFMPVKEFLSDSDKNRSSGTRRRTSDNTEKSYIRRFSSWFTRVYVDKEGMPHRVRVLSKNAGIDPVTGGAVWFSKPGTEPKSREEFEQMAAAYCAAPDPSPCMDENDTPLTEAIAAERGWKMMLTEKEADTMRKSGGAAMLRNFATPSSTTATPAAPIGQQDMKTGEVTMQGDLPF